MIHVLVPAGTELKCCRNRHSHEFFSADKKEQIKIIIVPICTKIVMFVQFKYSAPSKKDS